MNTTQLQDMITTIQTTQGAREFIVGSEKIEDIAQAWVDAGFSADTVGSWWESGCFAADQTASLRDAGLEPSDVSGNCPNLDGSSWGYAHSNGDVTTQDVIDACK